MPVLLKENIAAVGNIDHVAVSKTEENL